MEMNRAYSVLQIKAVDDDLRIITGIATTPEPDRVGDVVEPLGAKFANPLPLLWQHRHDSPVGTVVFDKPTKFGIKFKATLPIIEEAGVLKDMVDMAWQSVKAKLVRGVSIGFRAIEYSFMEGGGIRFAETEIMELSLVTVPANAYSVSLVSESNLPISLALVDPSGLTLGTANSSSGVAVLTVPVNAAGTYLVKVINLNLGPVQVWTAATPNVHR